MQNTNKPNIGAIIVTGIAFTLGCLYWAALFIAVFIRH